jgi:urease accessory protein
VISTSRVTVGAGGRLLELDAAPPLTVRRVHGPTGVCALCMVGSAAGPLAGDDVRFELTVEADACADLAASGASLAQGRPGGAASTLTHAVRVAARASLLAEPPALIVCEGSSVHAVLELDISSCAEVRWLDTLVLGRTGEPSGTARVDWTVRRDGRTLLRQTLDLDDPATRAWPGLLAGARVVATAFIAGPHLRMATHVDDPAAVAQRIDDNAGLITVLDTDAASARKRARALLDNVSRR